MYTNTYIDFIWISYLTAMCLAHDSMHIRKLCYSACVSFSLLTSYVFSVLLIFREFWSAKSAQKHGLPVSRP